MSTEPTESVLDTRRVRNLGFDAGWQAHEAFVASDHTVTTTTETQWGVRYGDGEVEWEAGDGRTDAESWRAGMRLWAEEVDAPTDFEPMSIVRRTVTTTVTGWEEVK